mmetsp:Transcript_87905/g.251910  ORF Transcript_87905/g.251910 Transcript_87905/m.251910 type:complete len:521 (+) Transcript_87905:86-1648(+)
MGASQSNSGTARTPLMYCVQGEVTGAPYGHGAETNQALRGNQVEHVEPDVCAVCLSGLSGGPATTFSVPGCGHKFHTLCIASALQACQLCPLCRGDVANGVCTDIAQRLLAEGGGGCSVLALELLMDLRSRGQARLEGEVLDDEIIDAIRRASKQGDATKIPAIAVFLGKGPGNMNKAKQSPEVRVAALEALRALVPVFSSTWFGFQEVLTLLRGQCLEDNNKEVRIAALRALREVCPKGEEIDTMTVRRVLEDPTSDSDVRQEATETLRVLAEKNDPRSARTALAALLDKDAGVRSVALSTLRSLCVRGSAESNALMSDFAKLAVEHQEVEVRCAALELIGHAEVEGGMFGVAACSMALQDREEEVQLAALAVLRRLWKRGDTEAVGTLATLIVAGNDSLGRAQVRCEAVRTLPRIAIRPDARASSAALAALADADSSVRVEAAQTLKQVCERGDKEVSMRLLAYFSHSDTEVQRLALETLGTVASREDFAVKSMLKKLIDGGDTDLQMLAEGAMRQLR